MSDVKIVAYFEVSRSGIMIAAAVARERTWASDRPVAKAAPGRPASLRQRLSVFRRGLLGAEVPGAR